jgi:hypothetical protein
VWHTSGSKRSALNASNRATAASVAVARNRTEAAATLTGQPAGGNGEVFRPELLLLTLTRTVQHGRATARCSRTISDNSGRRALSAVRCTFSGSGVCAVASSNSARATSTSTRPIFRSVSNLSAAEAAGDQPISPDQPQAPAALPTLKSSRPDGHETDFVGKRCMADRSPRTAPAHNLRTPSFQRSRQESPANIYLNILIRPNVHRRSRAARSTSERTQGM